MQLVMQLVLWNKGSLTEQGYNGFPEISIPFMFSRIIHRPLVVVDGCNKCCKIKTVSLTYGSLQRYPSNNDTTIEEMNGYNTCHQINLFDVYIPETKEVP